MEDKDQYNINEIKRSLRNDLNNDRAAYYRSIEIKSELIYRADTLEEIKYVERILKELKNSKI